MSFSESIPLRLAKLNQLIEGKAQEPGVQKHVISKDGLLDSLIALHDECVKNLASHPKNPPKHVSSFIKKGTTELNSFCFHQFDLFLKWT